MRRPVATGARWPRHAGVVTTDPGRGRPPLVGIHQVRLPVDDVVAARGWLVDTFGFASVLEQEDEEGVTGAVLSLPSWGTVALHADAAAARGLGDFRVLVLAVEGRQGLTDWVEWFDAQGVRHGPLRDSHTGVHVDVPGPGGLGVRLHTGERPEIDEA